MNRLLWHGVPASAGAIAIRKICFATSKCGPPNGGTKYWEVQGGALMPFGPHWDHEPVLQHVVRA